MAEPLAATQAYLSSSARPDAADTMDAVTAGSAGLATASPATAAAPALAITTEISPTT